MQNAKHKINVLNNHRPKNDTTKNQWMNEKKKKQSTERKREKKDVN